MLGTQGLKLTTTEVNLKLKYAPERRYFQKLIHSRQTLRRKSLAIFGVGQTGQILAVNVAKSGIGSIHLFDRDYVEDRNIGPGCYFSPSDIGKPKVEVMASIIRKLAPWTRIYTHIVDVPAFGDKKESNKVRSIREIADAISNVDIVATNFDALGPRLTVVSISHKFRKPVVDAGIFGLEGQVLFMNWRTTPCLFCLKLETSSQSFPCDLTTVFTGGIVASIQAYMIIEALSGNEINVPLVLVDLANMVMKGIKIGPSPKCPLCGGGNE